MGKFEPSMELSSTATAKIVAGAAIDGDLIRFRAVLSNINADEDTVNAALSDAFDGNVRVLADTVFEIEGGRGGSSVIEAFALARPASYSYEGTVEQALTEHASATGHTLKVTAGNMYMDENDQVWAVARHGDTCVITRDAPDDVMELLASANAVATPRDTIQINLDQSISGPIQYVSRDGEVRRGIAFAAVAGTDTRVEVLDTANPKNTDHVDLAQIVAYSAHKVDPQHEMFQAVDTRKLFKRDGSVDVLEYYRILYNNDPAMMEALEQLLEGTR